MLVHPTAHGCYVRTGCSLQRQGSRLDRLDVALAYAAGPHVELSTRRGERARGLFDWATPSSASSYVHRRWSRSPAYGPCVRDAAEVDVLLAQTADRDGVPSSAERCTPPSDERCVGSQVSDRPGGAGLQELAQASPGPVRRPAAVTWPRLQVAAPLGHADRCVPSGEAPGVRGCRVATARRRGRAEGPGRPARAVAFRRHLVSTSGPDTPFSTAALAQPRGRNTVPVPRLRPEERCLRRHLLAGACRRGDLFHRRCTQQEADTRRHPGRTACSARSPRRVESSTCGPAAWRARRRETPSRDPWRW